MLYISIADHEQKIKQKESNETNRIKDTCRKEKTSRKWSDKENSTTGWISYFDST